MDWYEFTFITRPGEVRDILVARLNAIGFSGFEETDECLIAYTTILDEDAGKLIVEIEKEGIEHSHCLVAEQNWNLEWERNFEPVLIDHPETCLPTVYLRAAFHLPGTYPHEIVITPKMSFGTGHHATTSMMIQQMLTLNFYGHSVLDFGTGTGILAILAEKLGAQSVIAIDNDEWSIANAKENFETNSCHQITLFHSETIPDDLNVDIILANINLNVITDHIAELKRVSKPNGFLLASGFLTSDHDGLGRLLSLNGFVVYSSRNRDGWLNLLCKGRK